MTTQRELNEAMVILRESYPQLVKETPEEWARKVKSYHNKLRRFDVVIVGEACERAIEEHPRFFPTTGQIVNLCKRIDSETKSRQHVESEERRQREEEIACRDYVMQRRANVIPDTSEEQRLWVESAPDPFVRLARQWEVESKNGRFDPNKPSPRGVGERRGKELNELMEQAFSYDPDPTISKPEPGWDG